MHIRIFHHSRRLAAAILGFLLTCAGLLTGIQAEPLGEWFIRNPLPQANTLSACAYGNGRWVALGTGGALVSSTDGEVWVAGSKPPEFTKESNGEGVPQINAMVYGGGQFVAVGMLGMVWTSPDGLNWTSRQSGDKAYTLTCIAYGNGIFVAGGHTNDTWGAYPLLSSTDGIHWENRAPINVSYETVAFGNGVFIVSGDGTAPWRSLNGKNWTPVSGAPTYPSGRVAFGADKFILYQRPKGYTDYTFSSKDGLSWIKTGTTGDSPGREFICPMIGTENGFVMAGIYNPTTLTSEIYTSPDGIIWTSHAFPNGSGIPLLCHGGGLIVAVGYGGEIHTSTNGQVWTSRMTESYHLNDVTYANGLYVAVGESYYRHWYNWSWNSTNGPAQSILTSPDGMNWTPRASLEGEHSSVAYGNGRFVTTGLSTSVDGLTWQLPPTNGPDYSDEVRFLNGMFVMVGDGIFTSSTGLNWELRQPIGNSLYKNVSSVAYGAGRLVAVGYDTDTDNALVYSSRDGISWTGGGVSIQQLIKVRFGNGRFLAVSKWGSIYSSTNGTTWKYTASPTPLYSQCALDYGNGEFVLGGADGDLWTSNDGVDWVRRKTRNSNSLAGITFANDTFVAVGDCGAILQSNLFRMPMPIIIGKGDLSTVRGQPFQYQISATNSPNRYTAFGLPAGLTLNTFSGVISGKVGETGVFRIKIGATNAGGTRSSSFKLTVTPPPLGFIQKPRKFPMTMVGKQSKAQILKIRNDGGAPLRNLRLSLAGPHKRDFIVNPTTWDMLNPGESVKIKVLFKPQGKGQRSAIMKLSGNAPAVKVTLTGKGLPARK